MGDDDVATVNALREYMGNVRVLVNQKSLSRGCMVFKKTGGFFFRQSYCECFLKVTPDLRGCPRGKKQLF